MQTLYDLYRQQQSEGNLLIHTPSYITNNISKALRPYQDEALCYFIEHVKRIPHDPTHLLFHMATGSGKTIIMASALLHLYTLGYRRFIFFVNRNQIIEKTKQNFLNDKSSKYLFHEFIRIHHKKISITEVDHFESAHEDDLQIVFTSMHKLHLDMTLSRENALSFLGLDDKMVLIADEAHHNKQDKWRETVKNVFHAHTNNLLLEFTATISKHENTIYKYDFHSFREDGYSKNVHVIVNNTEQDIPRYIVPVLLSQYRQYIFSENAYKINAVIKPVIMFKSQNTILCQENYDSFQNIIQHLNADDIETARHTAVRSKNSQILQGMFQYLDAHGITPEKLIFDIQSQFTPVQCLIVHSNASLEEYQIPLNHLEDSDNPIRAVFAVDMLNEGWDVLNLFDIVKLYDSVSKSKTTQEAQLIGRGARYCPFDAPSDTMSHSTLNDASFKRKFDDDKGNELAICEVMCYHCKSVSSYVADLQKTLQQEGIQTPPPTLLRSGAEEKQRDFSRSMKKFFKLRAQEIVPYLIETLPKTTVPCNLSAGATEQIDISQEEVATETNRAPIYGMPLCNIHPAIWRKATQRNSFFQFDNLSEFFQGEITGVADLRLRLTPVPLLWRGKEQDALTPEDLLYLTETMLSLIEHHMKTMVIEKSKYSAMMKAAEVDPRL